MNSEGIHSGNKGTDVSICSEEERKLSCMGDTRIRRFMQMELEACMDEMDWLGRCYLSAVNDYLEENCPPMPLPVPPGYYINLEKRAQIAAKSILPPTLKIILKKYYPLLVHPRPSLPQPEILPCSSPLPCTERSRQGMARPRVILLKHRQMDWKRSV